MSRFADQPTEAGSTRDDEDVRDDDVLRQVEREAQELAAQLGGLERRRSGPRRRFRSHREAPDQRADD